MKKTVLLTGILSLTLGAVSITGCTKRTMKNDEYTKDGRLIINFRNLYFDDYAGGDTYLSELEKMMGISCKLESYNWNNWTTQVTGQVMADTVPDVFHANIDSYNFASLYKFWAEEEVTKPLPDDLSKWPHVKEVIDNTTNVESLKLGGKLYGIPIAKNTTDFSTNFSPFTYIYRRDWAKQYGVYQENDEYTWDQFKALLAKFNTELKSTDRFALGDVEWGYPSITNFYKQVPHCFAQDATGHYVNNYTTDAYIAGLEESKLFKDNGWYGYPQNTAMDGDLNKQYYSNKCGVLYENLSYSNFATLKQKLKGTNSENTSFNIDDATAIMKIKSPVDNKYALEGTDNWFSMTFFDFKISDKKMEKILDLYEWLLSEEGTKFAIFGIEGYDYVVEDGQIKLQEDYWPKGTDGTYARKDNGAKYLRYMVSLGYDTLKDDPLTDKDAVAYLENWEQEMRTAQANGQLRVLKENAEVMWLTTPQKAEFSGMLRTDALATVMNYTYGKISGLDNYKKAFQTAKWTDVLNEINNTLGR